MATLGQRAGTGALIFASLLLTVSTAAADSLAELPSDTATIHSGRRALTAGAVEAAAGNTAQAAATFPLPTGRPYNIGRPAGLRHIWVDPRAGSDSRAGTGRATALRTLAAAWRRIPVSMRLTAGYHIHIMRGSLPTTAREFGQGLNVNLVYVSAMCRLRSVRCATRHPRPLPAAATYP